MMNDNQTKNYVDLFNSAKEFSEDLSAYNKCRAILKNYVRSEAIMHIQNLINRYKSEINQFGIFDHTYVIYGVDYSALNDFQIMDQLIYIGQRIPIYAFIREGEKKIADDLLHRIGNLGFDALK